MVKSRSIILPCAFMFFLLAACSKDENGKDLDKPVIETDSEALPQNCQVYVKGEEIPFIYTFTDNMGLGSYNIEIHHNFDHHTHSTDAGDCPLEEKKKPVKPWVYNQDFQIPESAYSYSGRCWYGGLSFYDPGDRQGRLATTESGKYKDHRKELLEK